MSRALRLGLLMVPERASRLLGRRVAIGVSDPWEFVDERGMNYFEGTIAAAAPFSTDVERESVLVDLDKAVMYRSVTYRSLLIASRHGEGLLDALSESDAVDCVLIGITDKRRNQPDVLDMGVWRGGLAGRVDVRLMP